MKPKNQSIVYSRPEKGNHLHTILYEIEMLEFCYETLVASIGKWGDMRNAFICLEAFLLHYRNLAEFFGGEAGLKASEPAMWSPRELSAEEVASISNRTLCEKYRGPISAYLQHCTPLRAYFDRSWNVYEMYKEIRPLIDRFQQVLSPKKVEVVSATATSPEAEA
jgi:hypothetical protein